MRRTAVAGIAVAVLVEHGGHGGSVAAPIAKRIIETYLAAEAAGVPTAGASPSVL